MTSLVAAAAPGAAVASSLRCPTHNRTAMRCASPQGAGAGGIAVAARFVAPAALRPRTHARATRHARVAAGSVRATATAPPDTAPAASPGTGQFDWAKAWYPMSPLDFLDPAVPNPMKVLGKSIVVWKAEGGAWKAGM